jgi:hypothetical protein
MNPTGCYTDLEFHINIHEACKDIHDSTLVKIKFIQKESAKMFFIGEIAESKMGCYLNSNICPNLVIINN